MYCSPAQPEFQSGLQLEGQRKMRKIDCNKKAGKRTWRASRFRKMWASSFSTTLVFWHVAQRGTNSCIGLKSFPLSKKKYLFGSKGPVSDEQKNIPLITLVATRALWSAKRTSPLDESVWQVPVCNQKGNLRRGKRKKRRMERKEGEGAELVGIGRNWREKLGGIGGRNWRELGGEMGERNGRENMGYAIRYMVEDRWYQVYYFRCKVEDRWHYVSGRV